jgi:hypothetical protein
VGLLTAIKDFRKGCYQLEWEHKRWGLGFGGEKGTKWVSILL